MEAPLLIAIRILQYAMEAVKGIFSPPDPPVPPHPFSVSPPGASHFVALYTSVADFLAPAGFRSPAALSGALGLTNDAADAREKSSRREKARKGKFLHTLS